MRKTPYFWLIIFWACGVIAPQVNAKEHIVKVITDNENGMTAFRPKFLMIKVGDTVTWVNTSNDLHNVITYPDGYPEGSSDFESPYLKQKDDRWSYTFDTKGTYRYHCIPHVLMGMRGTVTVEIPTAQNKFHKPTKSQITTYRDKLLDFFDPEDMSIMPDAVKRNIGN